MRPDIETMIDRALDVHEPSYIEVELQKDATRGQCLYVHVEGATLFRASGIKRLDTKDGSKTVTRDNRVIMLCPLASGSVELIRRALKVFAHCEQLGIQEAKLAAEKAPRSAHAAAHYRDVKRQCEPRIKEAEELHEQLLKNPTGMSAVFPAKADESPKRLATAEESREAAWEDSMKDQHGPEVMFHVASSGGGSDLVAMLNGKVVGRMTLHGMSSPTPEGRDEDSRPNSTITGGLTLAEAKEAKTPTRAKKE